MLPEARLCPTLSITGKYLGSGTALRNFSGQPNVSCSSEVQVDSSARGFQQTNKNYLPANASPGSANCKEEKKIPTALPLPRGLLLPQLSFHIHALCFPTCTNWHALYACAVSAEHNVECHPYHTSSPLANIAGYGYCYHLGIFSRCFSPRNSPGELSSW